MTSVSSLGSAADIIYRMEPDANPEAVDFAVSFVRLALRTLGPPSSTERDIEVLSQALVARTGLSEEAIFALVAAARAPSEQLGVDDASFRAFAARFGSIHAAALAEDTREQVDLSQFAAEHGSSESLLLLDTLFAMAAQRGEGVSRQELSQLRAAAVALGVDDVLVTALLHKHAVGLVESERKIRLGDHVVSIGRSTGCDVCLPDPQVALVHAEVVRQHGGGWRIVDQASGRPTLLNGVPVTSAPLRSGSVLQIANFRLRIEEDGEGQTHLVVDGERTFSSLSVRNLKRRIGEVSLLDDVSFTVFSGEVVAVVGPSGCGKTTLLHAISGVTPADSGDVLLDGTNFHALLQHDRSLMGVVPQDDLVHAELSVEESLGYSGLLRFPGDVGADEVKGEVERVLQELDIGHIRKSRIGDALQRGISGGQRKRVNLGQELMSRSTKVLFLDEPTSGLDPRASQDIVRLVRQLADRGRIVFLVTHDLTPEVLAQVDHLLVLVSGGRVAFFGPPTEGARYFQVRTPDAIFNRFADHPSETWSSLFKDSLVFRKFVVTRDHLLGVDGVERGPSADQRPNRRAFWRHFRTLTARYAQTRVRDRTGLAVLMIQPVFLAAVMAVVFPAPTAPFLFMLSLSCLWFGMSGSVRELIADRAIWQREARIGVGVLPYVSSKVLVLGVATVLQCAVLTGVLHPILDLGTYGFPLAKLAGVSGLLGLVGMALGLFVSAVWTSSEAAVGTLPLMLIPQITFSSIMVSVRDMGETAKALTWLTIQRYGFDAVIKCGREVAVPTYRTGEFEAQVISGSLWKLGLKFSDKASDQGFTLSELMGILGGFTAVMLVLTVGVVYARTLRSARGG